MAVTIPRIRNALETGAADETQRAVGQQAGPGEFPGPTSSAQRAHLELWTRAGR